MQCPPPNNKVTMFAFACFFFSIGVITYLLLCGRPPFNGNTVEELKYQIRHGKYRFTGPVWSIISDEGKNFVKRLLVRNLLVREEKNKKNNHNLLGLLAGPSER